MNRVRHLFPLLVIAGLVFGFRAATAQEGEDDGATADESAEGEGEAGEGEGGEADGNQPAESGKAPPAGDAIDVDGLRQEYLKLRDRLFRSRARAAAVATALYSTRVMIYLDHKSGRFYSIGRATIRLDGANVYDNSDGAIAKDKAPRFQGYIAPGRHVVTVRIEATGKDDDRFTTAVENSFVVQAVAGKDLEIKATAKDNGNIAFNWKKKERGSYKLHLDVSVKAVKRGNSDGRIQRK